MWEVLFFYVIIEAHGRHHSPHHHRALHRARSAHDHILRDLRHCTLDAPQYCFEDASSEHLKRGISRCSSSGFLYPLRRAAPSTCGAYYKLLPPGDATRRPFRGGGKKSGTGKVHRAVGADTGRSSSFRREATHRFWRERFRAARRDRAGGERVYDRAHLGR